MINSIRNTVLSILNKNNYGYISPSDFNLFAKQAQLEVFEGYFSEYNKVINRENSRSSGTDYGNARKLLEEAIETFSRTASLVQVSANSNRYYLPSMTTTGDDYFMINKVMCYNASVSPKVFLAEAEKVSHSKITMLNMSNLTSPKEKFPAYTQEGGILTVYPSTINEAQSIEAQYFRYPKAPKWTYISIGNGEPVFDQSQPDYQDFEVPLEDEYKLVAKILQYCGMSIREIQVAQFGAVEEQKQSQ